MADLGEGAILFHKRFEFTDGAIGEKLIVVLNNPDPSKEPYLTCRTTSQERNKTKIPGCQEEHSLFFLPASHDFFKRDTWIQLHEIFPFDAKTLISDHLSGSLTLRGQLQPTTIRQLMNCIRKIKDISGKHRRMILES